MRISSIEMAFFRGFPAPFPFEIADRDGKPNNAVIYGDNGSGKSSLFRALQLLFEVGRDDADLLSQQNLFAGKNPALAAKLKGKQGGADHEIPLSWQNGDPRPTSPYLQSSARRSAFIDYRTLLRLSDETRDMEENFFYVTVTSLLRNAPSSVAGETIGDVWGRLQDARGRVADAERRTGQSALSGVNDPVRPFGEVESATNDLSDSLRAILLPQQEADGTSKPSRFITLANKYLKRFENGPLNIEFEFIGLSYARTENSLEGASITPKVSFCEKTLEREIMTPRGQPHGYPDHHSILNEARLSALALSLFFASVKLADQEAYIVGAGEPDQPLRLLVLDDLLLGLDYSNRLPVLELLLEEFPEHQIFLLTHDRVWFDIVRLHVEGLAPAWDASEFLNLRKKGPGKSDFPKRKDGSSNLIARANELLNLHGEPFAAGNYARRAIEGELKRLCELTTTSVVYKDEGHSRDTDDFLKPLSSKRWRNNGTWLLLPQWLQREYRALRRTVLNPSSHDHPNTITPHEVQRAIAVAEKLAKIRVQQKKRKKRGLS